MTSLENVTICYFFRTFADSFARKCNSLLHPIVNLFFIFIMLVGITLTGRRLSLSFLFLSERRDSIMITIEELVSIISICICCFELGFSIGQAHKTKK